MVDAAIAQAGLKTSQRYIPCVLALAIAIKQVRDAIDMELAVRLALETLFGAAKMMPMSRRAFATVNKN